MHALPAVAPNPRTAMRGSLLPERLATRLRRLEHYSSSDCDPTAALRETIATIWTIVEGAASERALDVSQDSVRALLARRELVRHGTCILSTVIRRGVASDAFRPACPSWAIQRLPFAIVAGACVHWVFGLSQRPAVRANTAVEAALEVLAPVPPPTASLRTLARSQT